MVKIKKTSNYTAKMAKPHGNPMEGENLPSPKPKVNKDRKGTAKSHTRSK
jgi:hypothetical protein